MTASVWFYLSISEFNIIKNNVSMFFSRDFMISTFNILILNVIIKVIIFYQLFFIREYYAITLSGSKLHVLYLSRNCHLILSFRNNIPFLLILYSYILYSFIFLSYFDIIIYSFNQSSPLTNYLKRRLEIIINNHSLQNS